MDVGKSFRRMLEVLRITSKEPFAGNAFLVDYADRLERRYVRKDGSLDPDFQSVFLLPDSFAVQMWNKDDMRQALEDNGCSPEDRKVDGLAAMTKERLEDASHGWDVIAGAIPEEWKNGSPEASRHEEVMMVNAEIGARVCVDLRTLYDGYHGDRPLACDGRRICHPDDDYYDIMAPDGTVLCCDGEECRVTDVRDGVVTLVSGAVDAELDSEKFQFRLSEAEFHRATGSMYRGR